MADPPQSLLDQASASPGNAIASLLAPLVSGGAIMPRGGNLLNDQDVASALPSFLAFGARLAAAGAPTLGPPMTMPGALTSGLDAGYNAARQQQMMPVLQAAAAREAAAQNLDLEQKQFEFDRQRSLWNMTQQFMAPGGDNLQLAPPGATPGGPGGAPGTGGPAPGASAVPGPGDGLPPGAAGSATAIAQLPDVKSLPDSVRVPVIQTAAERGMSLEEAAQWARIIKTESNGVHIDPKTGAPLASAKGAIGAGQVMPATFNEMQQKYGIQGSVGDLMPNLQASANYFHEGVVDNGNLNAATVRYNAGPRGLEAYQQNGTLPAETADFVVKTGAPPPPGATGSYYDPTAGRVIPVRAPAQFAGPGAPAPGQPAGQPGQPTGQPPAPGAPSSGNDPLVVDPLTHSVVPRSIAQAAIAALRGGEVKQPGSGMAAGSAVITEYLQRRAALPQYAPGAPGSQIETRTGQTTDAPIGATVASPLTDDEKRRFVPNAPATTAYVGQRFTTGPFAGQLKGDIQAIPAQVSTVASPLTPDEETQLGPHKLPGVDYIGKRYTTGPNAGQLESVEPLNPRGTNLPFENTMQLNAQVESSTPWKLWSAGAGRYDAVIAALNEGTRPGDRAAIESLAKVFDPNVEVSGSALHASGMYGGVPQLLQEAWGAISGGSSLPDDVRQQIASLATAEMKTRDQAVLEQIQRTRALASAFPGVNAQNVMPLFKPQALTAADVGDEAPAGVKFAQPWQWNPGTHKFVRGNPAGAAQPPAASLPPATAPTPPAATPGAPGAMSPPAAMPGAPGATTPPAATPGAPGATPGAPPGATATPAPNTGPPSLTDALTPEALRAIPVGGGGLARLGDDMQRNPGNYSMADRQLYMNELKRRGHHQ
jgi:hypothetical protein